MSNWSPCTYISLNVRAAPVPLSVPVPLAHTPLPAPDPLHHTHPLHNPSLATKGQKHTDNKSFDKFEVLKVFIYVFKHIFKVIKYLNFFVRIPWINTRKLVVM